MKPLKNESRHTLAPYLQNFFMMRMRAQLNLSPHTVNSYRDTFRILFDYIENKFAISPDKLFVQHLDEGLIANFLNYLENDRNNSISTRNNRLAALHSFFKYVQNREPDLLFQCQQILNLPVKRHIKKSVCFLQQEEHQTLLNSIKQSTWFEKRDYLIISFLIETGVRVSELTAIVVKDISLNKQASVRILGKGRKERHLPLDKSLKYKIEKWIQINRIGDDDYLFTHRQKCNFNKKLSRDNIERILNKYVIAANLQKEIKITPHTLRHTFAMRMLKSGNALPIIALWLGHEDIKSTMIYIHADLEMKRAALNTLSPIHNGDQHSNEDGNLDDLRHFLNQL